jgi:hypothetical protein
VVALCCTRPAAALAAAPLAFAAAAGALTIRLRDDWASKMIATGTVLVSGSSVDTGERGVGLGYGAAACTLQEAEQRTAADPAGGVSSPRVGAPALPSAQRPGHGSFSAVPSWQAPW